MIPRGSIIEYLDNGKFICALVLEGGDKRVRLLNQNGRELKLPAARVVIGSRRSHSLDTGREALIALLRESAARRREIAKKINVEEVWEIVCEEPDSDYGVDFLAELCFGDDISDDQRAAFMRAVFADRLFFKYRKGTITVHSPEKVEILRLQREKERQRQELLQAGAAALVEIMDGGEAAAESRPQLDFCLQAIRDFYLFGSEAAEADLARELLKKAGLNRPHDAYHLLVRAGIWKADENLALARADIPVEFSSAAKKQTAAIVAAAGEKLRELSDDPGRLDFSDREIITIDGAMTRDYDDALHVEHLDNGGLRVGIHIADVCEYVKPDDPLFAEAAARATSIYFPEGQLSMLPPELSQDICSLVKDQLRPAISFLVDLDSEARVTASTITPSLIRVRRRLSYSEADRLIAVDGDLAALDRLAKKLRARRLDNGALLLPFPDVVFHIDDSGVEVSLSPSDTASRVLIAELMILANTLAARYLSDREAPGLFRSQPPPKKRLVFGDDTSLLLNSQQRKRLSRGELSTRCRHHSGLGVGGYTTVTSPIRRFLDLVVLHQINSMIRGRGILFSLEQCRDFAAMISQNLGRAAAVKQQRHRYWLLRYLEGKVGKSVKALVINRGPRRINLLLTDCLLDVDLPVNPARPVVPGDEVLIRVERADALDNTLRVGW